MAGLRSVGVPNLLAVEGVIVSPAPGCISPELPLPERYVRQLPTARNVTGVVLECMTHSLDEVSRGALQAGTLRGLGACCLMMIAQSWLSSAWWPALLPRLTLFASWRKP